MGDTIIGFGRPQVPKISRQRTLRRKEKSKKDLTRENQKPYNV
jgi:hypothetical protein